MLCMVLLVLHAKCDRRILFSSFKGPGSVHHLIHLLCLFSCYSDYFQFIDVNNDGYKYL